MYQLLYKNFGESTLIAKFAKYPTPKQISNALSKDRRFAYLVDVPSKDSTISRLLDTGNLVMAVAEWLEIQGETHAV